MGVIGLAWMTTGSAPGWTRPGRSPAWRTSSSVHAKADQEAQVAVLGGQRGDDDAKTQPQPGHHQHQHGGEQDPGSWAAPSAPRKPEIDQKSQEEAELDAEGDQVGDQDRDRHRQAREIDLAEQVGVADEGVGGLVQAVGEVGPDHVPDM